MVKGARPVVRKVGRVRRRTALESRIRAERRWIKGNYPNLYRNFYAIRSNKRSRNERILNEAKRKDFSLWRKENEDEKVHLFHAGVQASYQNYYALLSSSKDPEMIKIANTIRIFCKHLRNQTHWFKN